ncbi:MAG: HpcH/HpaI aldolase/citrate lyase family protein [Halobacteriaceae archaeon]
MTGVDEAFKQAFADRAPLAGHWLSLGSPALAELTAILGFDFALVDYEHAPTSMETIQGMIHAAQSDEARTDVIVRLPDTGPTAAKQVLDAGAAGVMAPMIDDADAARDLVANVRYPPDGRRGIAGSRATGYAQHFESYVTGANEKVVAIAQIETEAGLENVADVVAVDGIDALFVGPADLSGSLGVFAEWDSPRLADAMDRVVAAAQDADIPAGTLCVSPEDIPRRVDQGFDFLIVGKDTSFLARAATEAKATFESAVDDRAE